MNGYWYFTRFETGKEYPIYARSAQEPGGAQKKSCST